MAKNIFCIIGLSGSGKTTYFDHLMDLINKSNILSEYKIKPLVYHTTRSIRRGEDSNAYIFDNDCQFIDYQDEDKVLEWRMYEKYDETVYYYTLYEDIKDDCDAYICTASVDQLLSYINSGLYNIYIINISVPVKIRLMRLIQRANTDNECYEACRRAIEEQSEYNRIDNISDNYMKKNWLNIYNYSRSNNDFDTAMQVIKNLDNIESFIKSKLVQDNC